MKKISVLLATNRINRNIFPYIQKCIDGLLELQENTFTKEFMGLCTSRLLGVSHFLEPTLRSLESQTFKDYEFILSHRYPEDVEYIKDMYNIPIKVVKEKHSIWHDLGEQYHTVANNKNTAFINSTGELIYHIDDLTFFNENLLQEAWDMYKGGKYITGRTYRCITYNPKLNDSINMIGPNKTRIVKNGWKGEHKPLTEARNHPEIPMSMFWTCSASVSAKELLEINGYEELYDGSLAGIDMDAGIRLSTITKYKRVASNNYVYEIDDPTPKYITREDTVMRDLIRGIHPVANYWKPTKAQINRYKRWHLHKFKSIDENWNKFMDVPTYKLERKI